MAPRENVMLIGSYYFYANVLYSRRVFFLWVSKKLLCNFSYTLNSYYST